MIRALKRPSLPLWIAAVLPAALVGHGIAYAWIGASAADSAHAWVTPTLECSVALLVALCCGLLASALLRVGILAHTATERSVAGLMPRLCLAQLAVFIVMEQAEGSHASLLGCLVQVLVALVVAYGLALFSRLLVRCYAGACAASRYLERRLRTPSVFLAHRPLCIAHELAAHAGSARFQRPPPR